MSENEAPRDDLPEHQPLGIALTDLAETMPDDPYRVDGVQAKARRLRHRRRATRATVGIVAGAAVIATLVAVRPGPAHVSTVPAGQPAATIAQPSCDAALAAVTQAAVPPTPGAEPSTAADAAKQAAAATADDAVTGFRGVKGLGTIVSATDSTVTITPDLQTPDQPAEITATVGPTAVLYDGETMLIALPPLSPGERVAFGSTEAADGSYQLIFLAVHPSEQPTATADTVDPAVKAAKQAAAATADAAKQAAAANADAADEREVKGVAEVVSVQPDSLTIRFTDGDRADQVLTAALGPGTLYIAGDQKCVGPEFTAGQDIGVLLAHDDSGVYTARAVALFRPPSPRAATP